jgi:hypothetical protein
MDEVADRLAIGQLMATYTIEGDRGRVENLIKVFAEDGVLQIPTWKAVGRAGIFKALTGGGGEPGAAPTPIPALGVGKRTVRHHLTSSLVTFNGPDDATGRTYWINLSEKGPDHSGLYADTYRRIDGRWQIVYRDVRIDWKAADSRLSAETIAGGQPPGSPPLRLITG